MTPFMGDGFMQNANSGWFGSDPIAAKDKFLLHNRVGSIGPQTFGQTKAYKDIMAGRTSSITNNGRDLVYWTGKPTITGSLTNDGANIKVDLGEAHTVKLTDYLDYANFANDRIGDLGSILEHTRTQGGSIAFWTTSGSRSFDGISYSRFNLRYYRNNWGGNGYTGATTSVAKYLGKGTLVAQIALGAIEVGNGAGKDYDDYNAKGVTYGRNTVVTAAKVTSGIMAGMYAGAVIGSAIPIPIIGTLAGALGDAAVGYLIGEVVARDVGEAYDNFER